MTLIKNNNPNEFKTMVKKTLTICAFFMALSGFSQQVEFTEYKLDNGLNVILHQDNSAPVVTVGVMYHVGAKHEEPGRSGFAHFFEHLLFEGTENIGRGKWFDIVGSHGGSNNANTTQDRTYYYETFPSNNLELALWMESERMLHPVINQVGVDTQNEVVKEERRLRYENSPYGKLFLKISEFMFDKHPYRITTIGTMEDLDAAQLDEFKDFFKKFYGPNNATLVVSGDFDMNQTKDWIKSYFGEIPRGPEVTYTPIKEAPITEMRVETVYDPNISVPATLYVYRTPGMGDRDAYVLDMISTILTDGKSSRLYKKMVDDKKQAIQVLAFNQSMEDYGLYVVGALPMGDVELDTLLASIDEEIDKLQNELISEREFEKLQNIYLNNYVNSYSTVQGKASALATYDVLFGDANLINKELDIYQSITREEIKAVANKYLGDNERLKMYYLPESEKEGENTTN
ncbi:MAG TPA: pitrilysin family protein [Flavobacteriaceae bacterium]|nr:pitrilysin family protein [Flavobacteriaceae bacterium]